MMSTFAALLEKIQNKTAKIGIVGLGYVGLPLIRAFANAGFNTIGYDVDQKKVTKLLAGESYIKHIPEKLDQRMAREQAIRTYR